jgi:hypothetical protein
MVGDAARASEEGLTLSGEGLNDHPRLCNVPAVEFIPVPIP